MTKTKPTFLTDKEAEALMWAAAELVDYADEPVRYPQSAVATLRREGYAATSIKAIGSDMEDWAGARRLPTSPGPLAQRALTLAVERSSWIECYRKGEPTKDSPAHINEALATLRSLAKKLDSVGIEVNHIPYD